MLLAGADHAHIAMLRRFSAERPKHDTVMNTDIYLISEQPQKRYAGMLVRHWQLGACQSTRALGVVSQTSNRQTFCDILRSIMRSD